LKPDNASQCLRASVRHNYVLRLLVAKTLGELCGLLYNDTSVDKHKMCRITVAGTSLLIVRTVIGHDGNLFWHRSC
jgi:hypothetical protein